MKIHYFQRYQQKENVATANTMLLLSRFYSYSSDKFYAFIKSELFSDGAEPEIVFNLQEKSKKSIPDAVITQEGFKIIVETKLTDWFYEAQLMNHLEAFKGEKNKVLFTIASEPMEDTKKEKVNQKLREYNKGQDYPVFHINTTFERLADAVQSYLSEDRDYEMQEVLEDYLDYCYHDSLIVVSDSWKWMRVRATNTTFDFNIKNNVYYDSADHGFRPHDYLGLYKDKSVRAIGKITSIITAYQNDDKSIEYTLEKGAITDEKKAIIKLAIDDAKRNGYDLRYNHRYFFVEQFYNTDFKKVTPRAPMGARVFDLTQIIGTDDLPAAAEIAKILKDKTWE